MPWEKVRNGYTGKTLEAEASEMRAANIDPIVLRWRSVMRASQNLYGFYGVRTWTGEKLNGEMDISGEIDQNKITTFWPDEYRVGYAIVPKCKRNMDILAATFHSNPAWIIESPQDVLTEVKKAAEQFKPETSAKPEPRKEGFGVDTGEQTHVAPPAVKPAAKVPAIKGQKIEDMVKA